MFERRRFLALGGAAVGGMFGGSLLRSPAQPAAASTTTTTEHFGHHAGASSVVGTRATSAAARFTRRMPVPQVLTPTRTYDADVYKIPIRAAQTEFLPGKPSPVRTYAGQFVGPTIRAKTGRPVKVTFTNQLNVVSNVHLHGGHTPQVSDGYPMDLINPGASRTYYYPNTQQGTTLWYHDHAHMLEAENVYKGLHGFYILDDDSERGLRLPSGQYEVPIMLSDVQLDADGRLVWPSIAPDRTTVLANGVSAPFFPVASRKYRFRLLNGANERVFRLTLGGAPITQIGTDGGLLPKPVPRSEIVLGSAERADIVVDFTGLPIGSKLVLQDVTGPVLRFDVTRRAADDSRVPATLRPLPPLGTPTVERTVAMAFDLSTPEGIGLINGKPFDPNRVDFRVKRGTTEIWKVRNDDVEAAIPHTFHMHLEQFRVLDRDGRPPTLDDAGRKDTIFVAPGETVRVQATFTDHLGKYTYHCHFIDHSAIGMMAQMDIVP